MTDYFALFDEPRRPWLDADSLKTKFLSLSAPVHPDKIHSASPAEKESAAKRFAELNAAYNCLREPKERLRHLLELELGHKPTDLQQIPPDLADLFMEIGALCKQTDNFLAEKAKVSSPLLLAQLFERGQEWADKLMALRKKINQYNDDLTGRLKTLDEQWMNSAASRGQLLSQLEEVWRLTSFFARWSSQIQERLAQIAF